MFFVILQPELSHPLSNGLRPRKMEIGEKNKKRKIRYAIWKKSKQKK